MSKHKPDPESTPDPAATPATPPWQGRTVGAPQHRVSKKISITIGTPHNRDITPEYVASLARTLIAADFDYSIPPRNPALWEGTIIHSVRNLIFRDCTTDFLLFIDSDMAWDPEDIGKLVDENRDIMGGLVYFRRFPFRPAVYIGEDGKPPDHIPPGPFKCAYLGGAFLLISRKVIETFNNLQGGIGLPFDPLHRGGPVVAGSQLHMEDLSFCFRAKKLGFEIWCHPGLNLSHIGVASVNTQELLAKGFMGLPLTEEEERTKESG